MTDELNPDSNSDSFILAASMWGQFVAAYKANEQGALKWMVESMCGDRRSFGLTLGAAAEMLIGVLDRLHRDGDSNATQVWLDRQALNFTAAADAIVARHRGGDTPSSIENGGT